MISRPPAYLMFGLDENIQLVWYFLRRGFGGPLLFLWSLGVGIFLLVLGSTLSAVAWTGLAALTGAWMIYRCRYDPRVLDELIRSTMAERFPWRDLPARAPLGWQRKSRLSSWRSQFYRKSQPKARGLTFVAASPVFACGEPLRALCRKELGDYVFWSLYDRGDFSVYNIQRRGGSGSYLGRLG